MKPTLIKLLNIPSIQKIIFDDKGELKQDLFDEKGSFKAELFTPTGISNAKRLLDIFGKDYIQTNFNTVEAIPLKTTIYNNT